MLSKVYEYPQRTISREGKQHIIKSEKGTLLYWDKQLWPLNLDRLFSPKKPLREMSKSKRVLQRHTALFGL